MPFKPDIHLKIYFGNLTISLKSLFLKILGDIHNIHCNKKCNYLKHTNSIVADNFNNMKYIY